MDDLIRRQAAIDEIRKCRFVVDAIEKIRELPSAQPEPYKITDEQAILHLQSTGWMQNHDREMYESGLREQLADDSGSYDSLIPCKDTISRQSAIDALDKHCDNVCQYSKKQRSVMCGACPLGTAFDVIEDLPSAQQWILCSERLPERGKDVLVTRDYEGRADGIKSCRYVEVASCYGEDGDITWNSFSDEYKMRPRNHHVIAWMPLPDPLRLDGE